MKPLFIPLKTEFFSQFENGTKTDELRRYGAHWNERTCAIDRPVVLSNGYGKKNRLTGRITGFAKIHPNDLPLAQRQSVATCFGTLSVHIAKITIAVERTASR